MDIVIEHVPEYPTQEARPDTLEEAQLDAVLNASTLPNAADPRK